MSKKFKEKDYQEALDILADRELDDVGKMACRDLQELINEYEKFCKAIQKMYEKSGCLNNELL